jgi:CRP-like cAMP-binding protein
MMMQTRQNDTFNAQAFLKSAGIAGKTVEYLQGEVVFSQGDSSKHLPYIQKGRIQLSVRSKAGREVVLTTLGPGEFFGEGCLAGHNVRMGWAIAIRDSTVRLLGKDQMVRLLHKDGMSGRFIAQLLTRNIRTEEHLIDQLFNSSGKQLARTLLRLGRYDKRGERARAVPPISLEALAEMIGTTPTRVNFFMKKFQQLGFVDDKDGLKVHHSLLTVIL